MASASEPMDTRHSYVPAFCMISTALSCQYLKSWYNWPSGPIACFKAMGFDNFPRKRARYTRWHTKHTLPMFLPDASTGRPHTRF